MQGRILIKMKINPAYKVRNMAGESVIIMQGRYGVDMTRVISLNGPSLYLWESLQERDFEVDDVAKLLLERYDVDKERAEQDAAAWVEKLKECKLLLK